MRQLRTFLTAWLLLFVGATASAAISSGYYYIKSYNSKYLTENISSHDLVCSDLASSTNYAQVWYISVSGSTATLKNALTDRYVQGQGTASAQYTTGTSSQDFTLGEDNGVYTFKYDPYNFYAGGLHCDASLNVVQYDIAESKSKWTLVSTTINSTDLANQKASITEATNTQLTQFFTSITCTELKSTYKNYSDDNLRSAMSALPATTRDLAVKVKNDSWAKYSGWDKTEKTFRVADYKAYSSGSRWQDIIGYGRPLGRLSNPTGIYVESGEYLQVYVGTIPSGETVKLEVAGYGQGAGTQYQLHEGMNALQMASAGNCFVYYEVDNTTSGGTPYKALSNYADVTVHIEGGTVQGYFDLTKGYTNSDWTQLKSHLMTKNMFCMKTNTLVFNLQTNLAKTAIDGGGGSGSTGEVVEMLEYWQGIQDMEDDLFNRKAKGGDNYAYCNNVHSVTTVGNSGDGSLYASSYGIFFSPEQHNRLFNNKLFREGSDNLWASAHELGHHRQKDINMAGCTEVSNNIYSNVAVYQQGRYTSRTASIQETFRDYADGISWPERVKRSNAGTANYNQQLLHLNWQLYQYFHINGKQPTFFQDLFTALRDDPMTKSYAGTAVWTDDNWYAVYHVAAENDYLKYYINCCIASGYDLTDFFAAYGFFMLPEAQTAKTLNGSSQTRYTSFVDYAIYYLYVTQSMIDQAKAAVAALNLPKCNIVFIEDRVSAPLATYDGHATGELKELNSDSPVKAFGQVGEMGQYTTFDADCSAYSYNVDENGHVTTSGTGAVGFIVYDNAGNIIGFYNTTSFTLPSGVTNYTIKAAAGDGSFKTASLDPSITVINTDFPRTDKWYTFKSKGNSSYGTANRYVTSTGSGSGLTGNTTESSNNAHQWRFQLRSGESETFDIINRNDNSYIDPTASNNSQVYTTGTQPSSGWKVTVAGDYYIIYSGTTQLNQTNYIHSYQIYSWGGGSNTSDDNCLFTITAVADYEETVVSTLSNTALAELQGKTINVASDYANNLTTGQWYVMFDRGITNGYPHGYLYEKVSTHTLWNTGTVPSGLATDACKYLVRLMDAGNGKYYIQTGYGNYFGQIQASTNVPVIATKTQRITVAKIANTDGHFYLQGETGGVVLDANDLNAGDATVVGWGTTAPTTTGGNNDWAFYPVTLTRSLALNAVNGKSYATFYFDADIQTDEGTKAYYITNADNGVLQLTTVGNEGHDIPAYTAVVLINTNAATSATLSLTSGLSSVVTATDNLLKGTLTGILLDLSASSDYYSLGMNEGKVGFYKYNNGGTTTITLGANKAYLEVSSTTPSKGFVFGEETSSIEGLTSAPSPKGKGSYVYDLLGRKVMSTLPDSQTPTLLRKGIYIVNGKKVVIK